MNYAFGMLSLYVRDIEKEKAFYTGLLGMKVAEAVSGPTFVFLQSAGGTPIALQDMTTLPQDVAPQPGGFEINLEVDDVKAAYQEWQAKSAELLTEVSDMGAGLYFRARDPEGHIISVYELYPQVKAMQQ